MPKYQYNTSRKKATALAESTSVIGKGTAADTGQARDTVVTGVCTTLLNRMKYANNTSREEADVLYQYSKGVVDRYNDELSSIASSEEKRQELKNDIALKEKEKTDLQESKAYKRHEKRHNKYHEKYLMSERTVKLEEDMRQKERSLPSREALSMTHARNLADFQMRTETSTDISEEDRTHARELYTGGLKRWEKEQDELDADRKALKDYKDSSAEHLTDEYYEQIKQKQQDAKAKSEKKSEKYNQDQAAVKSLTDQIIQKNAELLVVLKEENSKKSALLDDSIKTHAALSNEAEKHSAKSAEYSRQHDKAALQYYILTRGRSAKKTGDVSIPGHEKDISEYVGRPALSLLFLTNLFRKIELEPKTAQKIIVSDMTDADHPADDKHITHDKLISLTEGDKTYRMDSNYTIQPDTPAGGAASGTGAPAAGAQPQKLKDLTSLSINSTEAGSNRYISTAGALSIQTIATGSIFHKQDVSGLWIEGEFVPANGQKYESPADARKSYQKKMEKGGAFDQDAQLAAAIRNSSFFRHIYAENIEHYAKYPGDDGPEAVALTDKDTSSPSPALDDLKTTFKDSTEDEKALTLFQYRNDALFNDLLSDDALFANASKERVIVKLVHAMIALGKDTDKAVEIAKNHGNSQLKKFAQDDKLKDFLLDVCSAILQGASTSKFTFKDFLSGAEEFLDDDGPFLKGTPMEGMINYDNLNDAYESINNIYGLASGKIQHIQNLEDQMSKLTKGSAKYDDLNKQKEAAEENLEHGIYGDILGIVTSVKDIGFSIIKVYKMIKDKRFLSEDNAAEKDLGSRYVCWIDYIFDVGNAILTPLNALLDLLSNNTVGVDAAGPVGEVVSFISDVFGTLENGYRLIQNSRKAVNITKSMDTITSNQDLKIASHENPQVMYYLGRARNKTGKDIADNAIDVTTGAVDSASHVTGKLGSSVIKITTTAISTLGKLITNGIYNGKEKTAALRAAFGNNYATYKKNPNFDRILKMTAGINSLKHLAVVSRIFAAIDTHHLLKAAPSGSFEFNLAKTAMSAFYKPKKIGVDAAKGGFDILPFSAVLKHVGEGDDWRSKLTAAIR